MIRIVKFALSAVLAGGVVSTSAQMESPRLIIEDPNDMESAWLQPFLEVRPAHPLDLAGLDNSVLYIFSPECPASRELHDEIVRWGRTLPENWRMVVLPAAGPGMTAPALVGFAARKAAHGQTGTFSERMYWHALYESVQSGDLDTDDIPATMDIAVSVGADRDALSGHLADPDVIDATITASHAVMRYQINRVPILVIGDRYLVHPDLVGQNPLDILRVGNALISQIHAENEAAAQSSDMAEAPGDEASQTHDAYRQALTDALHHAWQNAGQMDAPPSECTVTIRQMRGGAVISATAEPPCSETVAHARAVERFVHQTARLPYDGFEQVFEPEITLTLDLGGNNQ